MRWYLGSDTFQDRAPNEHARALFIELQDIYNEHDKAHPSGEDIEDKLDEGKDGWIDGAGERGEKDRHTVTNADKQPARV